MTEEAHELVQEVRLAFDRLIQLLDRVLFRSFDTTRDVSIRGGKEQELAERERKRTCLALVNKERGAQRMEDERLGLGDCGDQVEVVVREHRLEDGLHRRIEERPQQGDALD
jgi:hypothetical protein